MLEIQDHGRKICEGCRTGDYSLCSSFPGSFGERDRRLQKRDEVRKKKRKNRPAQSAQVYRRDMEFQYLSDTNARVILSAFQMSPEEEA